MTVNSEEGVSYINTMCPVFFFKGPINVKHVMRIMAVICPRH